MIKTYKPKSREFLAVQWDGTNEMEVKELGIKTIKNLGNGFYELETGCACFLAQIGDYVVFEIYEQVTNVVMTNFFEDHYEED